MSYRFVAWKRIFRVLFHSYVKYFVTDKPAGGRYACFSRDAWRRAIYIPRRGSNGTSRLRVVVIFRNAIVTSRLENDRLIPYRSKYSIVICRKRHWGRRAKYRAIAIDFRE